MQKTNELKFLKMTDLQIEKLDWCHFAQFSLSFRIDNNSPSFRIKNNSFHKLGSNLQKAVSS